MEMESLQAYQKKRRSKTTEPMRPECPDHLVGRYCIQEHHAKRAGWHEDVRFERNGVAVSFAVPKGLPRAPSRGVLAIHTEDHPARYLEWEGTIPDGSYGAGKMYLVDTGSCKILTFKPDKVRVQFSDGDRPGWYTFTMLHDGHWIVNKKRD